MKKPLLEPWSYDTSTHIATAEKSNIYKKFDPKDHRLTAPDDSIDIPLPTKEDIEWSKKTLEILKSEFEAPRFGNRETYRYLLNQHDIKRNQVDTTELWRLQFLFENGAEVNAGKGQRFYKAALNEDHCMMKLLLANGGDINTAKANALEMAVVDKNQDTIDFLLQYGADISILVAKYTVPAKHKIQMLRKAFSAEQISHWEAQSDTSILKRYFETDADTVITVRKVFNFKARQVETSKTADKMMSTTIQKFDQLGDLAELMESHKKLSATYENLPDISTYLPGHLKRENKSKPNTLPGI